ncbi:hypothetical protein, partial [Candidatus Bealeia paramacronuclearis]|uniref:hypothetical protein n=1 Tax=Candidatus Bealeia paramacronuclearis TaxID=1921001 RepID=UPI002F25FF7F
MMKKVYYYILFIAISAWPFLNFYGSEANQGCINVNQYLILFLAFICASSLASELLIKFLRIERARYLVVYLVFVIWFFNYTRFWEMVSTIHILYAMPHKSFVYLACLPVLIYGFNKLSKFDGVQKACQAFIAVVVVFSFSEAFSTHINKNNNNEKFYNKFRYNKRGVKREEPVDFSFRKKPNIYFLLL